MILAICKTLMFALAAAGLQLLANHAFEHVASAGGALASGAAAAIGYVLRSPFRRRK